MSVKDLFWCNGRRRRHQRLRGPEGITDAMEVNVGKLWEVVVDRKVCELQSVGLQRVGHDWVTEELKHY